MNDEKDSPEGELARIERFEALVMGSQEISDEVLISNLLDRSEPLRAEVLDYIADIKPSIAIVDATVKLAKTEESVQCVARLAFLSYLWKLPVLRESISYRPTIDEAEYILAWDYAGQVMDGGSKLSLLLLAGQAALGDWELSHLSRNLLATALQDEGVIQDLIGAMTRITESLTLIQENVESHDVL